jgi:hypothetical protein
MSAHEPGIAGRRRDDSALRRADVRHRRVPRLFEHVADARRKLRDGDSDDDEVRFDVLGHGIERAALERKLGGPFVGVDADDLPHSGALRREADRRADQPGADDPQSPQRHNGHL